MFEWTVETSLCPPRVMVFVYASRDGKPVEHGEVWLKLNGYPLVSTVMVDGISWFELCLPVGRYRLQPILYRVPTPEGEVMVEGPVEQFVVTRPSPLTPKYACGRSRCHTLSELPLYRRIARWLSERTGGSPVYLTGGIVERGWACNDVDFYVDAPIPVEECLRLKHEAIRRFCLHVDVNSRLRPPRKTRRGIRLA